ncbi:MAG: hypothetical protein CFH38_00949, partial [Alphaproteobacteria bacterium MarineAlpha10_Bin1]
MPSEVESRAIEEFRKTPIGHHSTDLQVILNELRALPMEDKHCLVCTKANREWQ